ncbi:MAG: HindVP family restriction endonuclease, partial [Microcoleus sp. SIO2G3]|nr:HindVP family restriction endonuclease [Microcoleus sp. SIO2G3]
KAKIIKHSKKPNYRSYLTSYGFLLDDFSLNGQINHSRIIDELSYDTRNDKAFSVNGKVTHPYMRGEVLTQPRITKRQIKEIILGGGQNLLSPERRFDAIIFNSPDIFD